MKTNRRAMRVLAGGSLLLNVLGPAAYAAENATDVAQALADASSAVDVAKGKGFLWTTAADALARAQAAAKDQDNTAVVRHAAVAKEQALLGVAQRDYPLVGAD